MAPKKTKPSLFLILSRSPEFIDRVKKEVLGFDEAPVVTQATCAEVRDKFLAGEAIPVQLAACADEITTLDEQGQWSDYQAELQDPNWGKE